MSWRAQSRSKGAKTPSVAGVWSNKPEPGLWPVQQYLVWRVKVHVHGAPPTGVGSQWPCPRGGGESLSPATQYVKKHVDSSWSRHIPVLLHSGGLSQICTTWPTTT